MPYVEGFGTYPFGEEWLFDAVARSYLPLLDVVRDLTMTVTPVLADQLEADGVAERLERFVREHRLAAAERDAAAADPPYRDAARAEAERYRRGLERLAAWDGDLIGGLREVANERELTLVPSAATHAVLPLLASRGGRALQIDAGLRSHRRRFGPAAGFWLPECAYAPGLERLLAERGVRFFCVDQSAYEAPLDALRPVLTEAGPVAFTIDWGTVELVWSWGGYPADPAYAEFHRKSLLGIRLWSTGGGAYDPEAAAARARQHADDFLGKVAARLRRHRTERGRAGLLVFAIDTELLGHWWWEGPIWLEQVISRASDLGVHLLGLERALAAHEPEQRALRPASWGEHKDLSTWDSRAVADLTWGARRLELRLARALGSDRLDGVAAQRAARELLAVQASDWAFLDKRGQAGDYPFARALHHSRSFLEAIDCRASPDPRMRNLAPDMSLAPLLEP
jgi:1,4-alpha-glucan branching enzyme